MNVQEIEIEKVIPYEKNAKKHPADQVESIARSISEFGFSQPIVVDSQMTVIVGHGRLLAAERLGLDKVPVLVLDGLTPEQAKAYRLADNKLNESGWIDDLVLEELKDLDSKDFDLSLTGFEMSDLEKEDEEKPEIDFTSEIMEENNYIVFTFDNAMDFMNMQDEFGLKTVNSLDSKKGYERGGVGRVIDGQELISRLNKNDNSNT